MENPNPLWRKQAFRHVVAELTCPSFARQPALHVTDLACHHLRRAFATGPDPFGVAMHL
jgi:hypothetical protein